MWSKILLAVIAISLLTIIQISFLGNFGVYLKSFNLVLAALVILLFLVDFKSLIFFTLFSGFILDLYSSLTFGLFMISLFLTALVLEIFLFNFLTNRSFYSVISLGLLAVILFNVIFLAISSAIYLFGLSDFYFNLRSWSSWLYQLLNISIILTVIFFIVNAFSKKFKPNFIRS